MKKLKITSYNRNPLTLLRSYGLTVFLLFCFQPFGAWAQQSETITLDLLNPTHPSTFVYTEGGFWEQTFNDAVVYNYFKSQVYSFSHLIEGPGSSIYGAFWYGFTACKSGDNSNHSAQGWNDYQWGCMAGGGIKTDAQGNIMTDENGEVMVVQGLPYLVAYWHHFLEPEWWDLYWFKNYFLNEPTHALQILLDNENEYEAVGVYVNIHPWTYYVNLNGDGGSTRPLNQEGDFFKLIIHGLNADGTESGNSVEHTMAKFENGQLIQNSKWVRVDLSSLGEIGGFYCTLATTINSAMGPLSPAYFCMDKLQVRTKQTSTQIPVTHITNVPDTAKVGVSLELTGTVVPENATYQLITWGVQSAGTTGATISGKTFSATGVGDAVVKATIENGIAMGENFTKSFTIYVVKRLQDAPDAPTLSNKTETSITLNSIAGCEYRMDGGNWQKLAIFEELTPSTTYHFEARKTETETHYASEPSETAQFATNPLHIDKNEFDIVKVFTHNNSVIIKNESKNEYKRIEIYDISGHLVYQGAFYQTETIIPLRVVSGIYNVVLYGRDSAHCLSTKLVINN